MPKLLALDYGKKNTGIAVTDDLQIIASALSTLPTNELINFLKNFLSNENVEKIIIGKPIQKDGNPSEIETEILKFIKDLQHIFPYLIIERFDERYTSKMAFNIMINSGINKNKRKNKLLIDKIAATIILQDYLQYKK